MCWAPKFSQSWNRHKVSEIFDDDETSASTRPDGINDNEQPDDLESIPHQRIMRLQIQDLCGKGDDDQALDGDLDQILNPARKEYEAKVQ